MNVEPNESLTTDYRIDEMGRYEELADLTNTYMTLQAFNSFFVLTRLLFELDFSKGISLIIDLLYESLFDIFFFVMTFIIVLFFHFH